MAMAAVPAFTTEGVLHPPTVIAACARMAGTYLFRSFGLNTIGVEPGQIVLSPQASEQTPLLLRTCAAILSSLGTAISSSPSDALVDEKTKPREEFLATQRRLDPVFAPLKAKYQLDDHAAARAAAVATGMAVHAFAKHVEANHGFGLAAFCFTEGSRTVPAPPQLGR
jgi:hypothetical protein